MELPEQTEIGDTLYCHASPHSDMQSFGAEPGPLDNELLEGVTAKRVVFGHTHVQFQRTGSGGIELLNPGSVGMPWDGDHRAAYAVIDGRPRRLPPRGVRLGGARSPPCESGWASCPRAAWSWPGSTCQLVLACRWCASRTP